MAEKFTLQEATPPTDADTLAEARAWLTYVDEQIRFLFELSIDIAERRGAEIERVRAERYCKAREVYGYPCEPSEKEMQS